MAVWAIGDIQGCYDDLQRLLEIIDFDPADDRLWFVGDLVNRGPKNLEVMRFVRGLGDRAVNVLGNHDLHLIAVAFNHRDYHPGKDTFEDVCNAPDADDLIDWLRASPLLHHDEQLGYTLVHAGIPMEWDLAQAQQCAEEMHAVLADDRIDEFLINMYGNKPARWREDLEGWDRLRFITNSFTRLRYCKANGKQDFKHNGPPGTQPENYMPWFEVPKRRNRDLNIVFGHWATLGLIESDRIHAIDTGCVWGGKLTAMRLDGAPQLVQCPCHGEREPELEFG